MKLVIDEKPIRVMKFTTQGPDWESEFWCCLGQPCNGWERVVSFRALRETTPWWRRVLRWASFNLLPDIHEWEVEYQAIYSRWE
jgi:hypothetical protein